MNNRILLFLCLCIVPFITIAEEIDGKIHNELRQLLKGIETAINSEKYADMVPYFHEKLHVTTINQEVLSSREEIPVYFKRWFGPDGYLKKLHIEFKPDFKTELYANKTVGVINGSGIENYTLSDTRYYEMLTRWTATLIKDTDGKWRVLTFHIGVNFLDNPILNEVENSLKLFLAGGVVVGLFVGVLLCWLYHRWRRPYAAPK